MDLVKLFEAGQKEGLFTDYQVCVRGPVDYDAQGGQHIQAGALMFDIASLTKAFTHLVYLKLFAQGKLSPESRLLEYLLVPGAGERRLWHFLSYVVQKYNFGFDEVRCGGNGPLKELLLKRGFQEWGGDVRHDYDNHSSSYLGMVLESVFGTDLERAQHDLLGLDEQERLSLLFHPVYRGVVLSDRIVPTSPKKDGLVHDPLARAHQDENLSVAGLFSNAQVVAEVFSRNLTQIVNTGFYDVAAQNQLERVGISSDQHNYAMGFDIPYAQSIETPVELPLIFAGYTGCRLFFAKEPRVTVCFLTNRVFVGGDSSQSRKNFSAFSWKVIREILRSVSMAT